jgi:Ca2+/Na+ antiporter
VSAVIMVVSAVGIILFVKFGLLLGIEHIAGARHWTVKSRGQVTGYATSVPELVCLVAAGLAGVWEAGLWNIASSNIINFGLMLVAVTVFRQHRDLFNRRFIDELGFALAAVAVPLVLMGVGLDRQWYLVPVLGAFFLAYRAVDGAANRVAHLDKVGLEQVLEGPADGKLGQRHSLAKGLGFTLVSLVCVALMGSLLGNATADVIEQFGIHPAVAGWILGTVTSLPEMVTFFAVYLTSRRQGTLHLLDDTQEVLDNLTGSNMANVGVVYPAGLLTFLIASSFLL